MDKKQLGKIFPNLNGTIASYSPISQFITLNNIYEVELPHLFKENRSTDEVSKASIYLHETRHNVDHLATLWGQKNLLKLSDALQARVSNKVTEFHKIIPLKKEENQFHYDEYYTEHYNTTVFTGPQDRWIWQLSSGIKFDIFGMPNEKEPIPFIKFSKPSGEPLVRVPLSIAALLETNSTFDEYKHIVDHINGLSKMEQIFENQLLSSKIFKDVIYNQSRAVYNSIVHLTANILKLTDVIVALEISSSVATLVLNLPSDLVKLIPISDIAKQYWKERNDSMLNNIEYGYIFYLLLSNFQPVFNERKKYELESLLSVNNLPSSNELLNNVVAEFKAIKSKFQKNKCLKSYFEELSEKGLLIMRERGLDGTNISTEQIIKSKLFTPDLICVDTEFKSVEFDLADIIKGPPEYLGIQERYSFFDLMNSKLDEFFSIRGL